MKILKKWKIPTNKMKTVILHGAANSGKTDILRNICDEIKGNTQNYAENKISGDSPNQFISKFIYRNLKICILNTSNDEKTIIQTLDDCINDDYDIVVFSLQEEIKSNGNSPVNTWIKNNLHKIDLKYIDKKHHEHNPFIDINEMEIKRILNNHKKKYIKTHLAAFVDILGFSDRLEKAGNDESKLKKIYDILKEIYSHHQIDQKKEFFDHKKTRIFSDCIYISSHSSNCFNTDSSIYDQYGEIISIIGTMQASLIITHKVFLRGGIAIGTKIEDNDGVEISSAYFNAVNLESQKAIFPIIIIGEKDAISILNSSGKENYNSSKPTNSIIRKEKGKDIYILDYISCIGADCCFLKKHKNAIVKSFNNTTDAKIRNKYRWLAYSYHNKKIREFFRKKLISISEKNNLAITKNLIPYRKEK